MITHINPRLIASTGVLSLALFALSPTAARADHRQAELVTAAHELEQAAGHFHELIHDWTGYSHLAADAHNLAVAAGHFHRTAESGASIGHLTTDFARVQSLFRHIEREMDHAHSVHHNRHVVGDWWNVRRAVYQVTRLLSERTRFVPHDPHFTDFGNPGIVFGSGFGNRSVRIGPFGIRF